MKTRLLATLVLALALPAHAYYPEWTRTSQATVYDIRQAVTADFNGDGRPDVATRTDYHVVRLVLTNSDGTFGTPSTVHLGDYLSEIVAADADGDGKADIILADTGTNSIVVLHSNGDGTFADPIVSAQSVAPTDIVAGDFDGDGKTDVALRSYSAQVLAVCKGDGAGHFAEISRLPLSSAPYRMAAGDVDGDGKLDVLIAGNAPYSFALYYGKGDGTFETPSTINNVSAAYANVTLADLDGDGDREIISCEFSTNTVNVFLNLGSRTFAARTTYVVVSPSQDPNNYGNPVDVVVCDATGDGKPDVVVTLANLKAIGTLAGNGTGSLAAPQYSYVNQEPYYYTVFPEYISAADFDGDGRTDLAITANYSGRLLLYSNRFGGLRLQLQSLYPTISVGQTAHFQVWANTPADFYGLYSAPPPFPTGTVTLKDGATPIGTGTFTNWGATIDVSGLGAGAHNITASFADDGVYRDAVSSPLTQSVVSAVTTTTLTSDKSGQELVYGTQWMLSADVASPLPGSTAGQFWLYTDGQRSQYTASGPVARWYMPGSFAPGPHTFYVTYEGNADQPPSTSNVVTQVFRKSQPVVTLTLPGPVLPGQASTASVRLESNPWGSIPDGNLYLYEGTTLLGTVFADTHCCSGGMTVTIPIPALSPGAHFLYVTYEGSTYFEPGKSATVKMTVYPSGPFVIDAAVSGTGIYVQGSYSGSNVHYDLYRRIGSGPWGKLGQSGYPTWSESNVQAGVVYAYQIKAYDSSNNLLATSNADMAMLVTFTDDVLAPFTTVKALHIKQLVDAVNVVRTAAGLSPLVLADAGAGQVIRASHILALRTAINEARATLGVAPVTFSTDVAPGTFMRVQDIQDLREALR
jgi:hypothetical protein